MAAVCNNPAGFFSRQEVFTHSGLCTSASTKRSAITECIINRINRITAERTDDSAERSDSGDIAEPALCIIDIDSNQSAERLISTDVAKPVLFNIDIAAKQSAKGGVSTDASKPAFFPNFFANDCNRRLANT
jgi:hypothetical protein